MRVEVGQFELVFVLDGEMRISPTAVMQGSTDQDWAAHANLLDGDGRLPLAVGGLLIRTGRQTVLVDVGLGPVDAELPDGSGPCSAAGCSTRCASSTSSPPPSTSSC